MRKLIAFKRGVMGSAVEKPAPFLPGIRRMAVCGLVCITGLWSVSVFAGEQLVGELPGGASVDNTGDARYNLTLAVPPGTADVQPTLSLSYSARGGNNALGLGFSLAGLSTISRAASDHIHDGLYDPVDFDSLDRLVLDGQRLILISTDKNYGESGSEYRTEVESFNKILLHGDLNSPGCWFEVHSKSGEIFEYGKTDDSSAELGTTGKTISWMVNRLSDTVGNYMDFKYVYTEGGEQLISSIVYTGNTNTTPILEPYNQVDFVYADRDDSRIRFMYGEQVEIKKRLQKIVFMVGDQLAHEYVLDYGYLRGGETVLQSVKQVFSDGSSVPATVFKWNDFRSSESYRADGQFISPLTFTGTRYQEDTGVRLVDFSGDGLVDLLATDSAYINTGSGFKAAGDAWHSPYRITSQYGHDKGVRQIDVNGDGRVDLLVNRQVYYSSYTYAHTVNGIQLNTTNGWVTAPYALPEDATTVIEVTNDAKDHFNTGTQLVDLNRDGLLDVVSRYSIPYKKRYGHGFRTYYWQADVAYTNSGSGWVKAEAFRVPYPLVAAKKTTAAQFVDLNGDGLVDFLYCYKNENGQIDSGAYLNTGTGWSAESETAYEAPFLMGSDAHGDTGVRLMDVNGDGLPDFVYHHEDRNGVISKGAYLNTGVGWSAESSEKYVPPTIIETDKDTPTGATFSDINGDGRDDLLCFNNSLRATWLGTPKGWVRDDRYDLEFPLRDGKNDTGSRLTDVNGDGLVDQIVSKGSEKHVWLNQTGKIGTLRNIITGSRENGHYSTVTTFTYSPLTDKTVYKKGSGAVFPTVDIQGPSYVVSALSKDNCLGKYYHTLFTYANGRAHRDRGFLGFQIFESYDPQKHVSQVETVAQDFPLTGVTLKTETYYFPNPDNPGSAQLMSSVDNVYLYDKVDVGRDDLDYPLFYYVAKSTEKKWKFGETDTNNVLSEVNSYTWFDGQNTDAEVPSLDQPASLPGLITYGNATKLAVVYDDGVEKVTTNSYYDVTGGGWILGRLKESTVFHIKSGCDPVIRTASFDYLDDGSGLLCTEQIEKGTTAELTTDYAYDAYGNITNKVVSGFGISSNSVQRSVYDDKGRFVVRTYNSLNHSETMVTDPFTGLVLSKTGPNGLTTSWTYDGLGRSILELRADGTRTETEYAWDYGTVVKLPPTPEEGAKPIAQVAEYRITTKSSGSPPVTVYYDHQGREIRKELPSPGGRTVLQDSVYDELGYPVAGTDHYFEGDEPLISYVEFDEIGREKLRISPAGTQTRSEYDGLETSVTVNYGATDGPENSRNQKMVTLNNKQGKPVLVTDNEGNTVSYEYDAVDNLVKTTDQAGHVITMKYDLLGKKILQDDPDMGEWGYLYNARGELIAQTNALGQVTTMEYDELGRKIKRTSPEGTARWFYDGEDPGCWLGGLRREELRDATGELTYRRTYAYDELGRAMLTLYNVDNKWYYTCNTYDEFSRPKFNYRFWRPKEFDGPDDTLRPEWNCFTTINTYNKDGLITKVADASGYTWWTCGKDDFDAKGNLLKYQYGNGVETTRVYDHLTGRLTGITAQSRGAIGGADILSRGYAYDRLGNMSSRRDYRHGVAFLHEDFQYDRLNRLVGWKLANEQDWKSCTYDEIGNIQQKYGVSGTYQYGTGNLRNVNDAGVHAVTEADGLTFRYDDNGNMLARTDGTGEVWSTTWTSFCKPKSIFSKQEGSEFTYDIDNKRITQITYKDDSVEKKIYLDGFEQEETSASGRFLQEGETRQWTPNLTRIFVSTPVGAIGVQVYHSDSADNIERKYFHTDRLGSIVAVSGTANDEGVATLLAEYSYDTWGKRRNASTWEDEPVDTSTLETDRGYTGHEMLDHLGLVHMNGRIYDSHLGRFLSADPYIQAPGDLQSYNRYSYVRNNPMKYTDPSGYNWVSDAWDGVKGFFKQWGVVIVAIVVAVVAWYLAGYLIALQTGTAVAEFTAGMVMIQGAIAGFASSFASTLMTGGSLGDALTSGLKGAFIGAMSAGMASKIGTWYHGLTSVSKMHWLAQKLMHGMRGAVASGLNGGDALAGFFGGFAGAAVGDSVIGRTLPQDITPGQRFATIVGATIAGGTASVIAGGKFENGAMTGFFGAVANELLDYYKWRYGPEPFKNNTISLNDGKSNKITIYKEPSDGPQKYSDYPWANQPTDSDPVVLYAGSDMKAAGLALGQEYFDRFLRPGIENWISENRVWVYPAAVLGGAVAVQNGVTYEGSFDERFSVWNFGDHFGVRDITLDIGIGGNVGIYGLDNFDLELNKGTVGVGMKFW